MIDKIGLRMWNEIRQHRLDQAKEKQHIIVLLPDKYAFQRFTRYVSNKTSTLGVKTILRRSLVWLYHEPKSPDDFMLVICMETQAALQCLKEAEHNVLDGIAYRYCWTQRGVQNLRENPIIQAEHYSVDVPVERSAVDRSTHLNIQQQLRIRLRKGPMAEATQIEDTCEMCQLMITAGGKISILGAEYTLDKCPICGNRFARAEYEEDL